MKMLYLSCHSVLEYHEVKLFREIGIDVFSHGAYLKSKTDDIMRPALDYQDDERLVQLAMNTTKENLSPEFLKEFDTIMVMHNVQYPFTLRRQQRVQVSKKFIAELILTILRPFRHKLSVGHGCHLH